MAELSPSAGGIVPLKWESARIPSTASTAFGSCTGYESSDEECDCPSCRQGIGEHTPHGFKQFSDAASPPREAIPSVHRERSRRKVDARTFGALLSRSRAARRDFFTNAGLQLRTGQWSGAGAEEDVQTQGAEGGADDGQSPEMHILGLGAVLFATMALLQISGALFAHSHALLIDCISMGVDAASYGGSMVVEAHTQTRMHAPLELLVGGASLVALVSFTVCALRETGLRISQDQETIDDVKPGVVLVFSVLGLLFDLVSLYAFWKDSAKSSKRSGAWVAIAHVTAHSLRSLITLTMSLLILLQGVDGKAADAWASLLVGATILCGAALGLGEWLRQLVCWVAGCSLPFGVGAQEAEEDQASSDSCVDGI